MKRTIIIGATSDIGTAMARLLVKNNHFVGIADKCPELLEKLKKECPNTFKVKALDIVNTRIAVEQLEELLNELGGLDLIIICSGIYGLNKELDFGIEKRTINHNVIGFTCVADWAYNYFERCRRGHLVILSSFRGLFLNDMFPAYEAVNAYQIHYLESLRQKTSKFKRSIILTDIRCGLIESDMISVNRKLWVTSVDTAAEQIIKAIIDEKKVVYITKRWKILVPIFKLMPRSIYDRMLGYS